MEPAFRSSRLVKFNTGVCLLALMIALPWTAFLGAGWMSQTFLTKAFFILCIAGLVFRAAAVFYAQVRRDACLARILHASALLPVMIFTAVTLTYLVPTLQMPMADAKLAAIDRWVGFDFNAFAAWASRQAMVRDWAFVIYSRMTVAAIFIVMVYLIVSKRADEFERCLSFLTIAAVVTIILAALMPAGSAFAYHNVHVDVEERLGTVVGADYNHYYARARAGDASVLDLGPRGMVSFPSFHTVLGLMCVFYLRSNFWLLMPVAACIGLMIATTPLIGGHFLADVLAGFLVAVFAYWLVDRIALFGRAAPPVLQAQKV